LSAAELMAAALEHPLTDRLPEGVA
jgi:hypothetical protein